MSTKPCLLVLGMHRSGTSATTGALACMGVTLGRRLYSGHRDVNPRGYFENSRIADANDEILYRLGSCWDDILPRSPDFLSGDTIAPYRRKLQLAIRDDFRNCDLPAIKDPRICRLLPLWLPLLAELGYQPRPLLVLRSPWEVAASLQKRDGFSAEKSLLLWCLHYLEAELQTRGQPRAVMAYGEFLADPVTQLERVAALLALSFPHSPAAQRDALSAFVSPALQHHHDNEQSAAATGSLAQAADELHGALAAMAASDDAMAGAVDCNAATAVRTLQQDFSPLLAEHCRQVMRLRGHEKIDLIKILRSASWILGKPVRAAERLLGRDV